MVVGILLLILGVLMLLERIGLIRGDFWDFVWPAVLVAFGIALITRDRKKQQHVARHHDRDTSHEI